MSNVPPPPTNLRGAVDLSSLVSRQAQAGAPAESATGQPPAEALTLPSLYFEGTDANFNDFIDLSMRVPVIVDLGAEWSEPWKQLTSLLDRLIAGFGGRLVIVKVDVDANPQLAQAFQAQSVPAVAALVAGRPVQLFVGAPPEDQLRDVFEQLLELAAQNGVTGTVTVEGGEASGDVEGAAAEPAPEPPLPPLHAEAYDAIERGDLDGAIAEYRLAIAQNPADDLAVAGLAQVSLLKRLSTVDASQVRDAAASAPKDADAALAVADLDLSGGHVDDAFGRLLDLFATADPATRDLIRTRLVDYFEIVGVTDPRVIKARGRLASLLY